MERGGLRLVTSHAFGDTEPGLMSAMTGKQSERFWPEKPVRDAVERSRLHAQIIEDDFDIREGSRIFEITVGDRSLAPYIARIHEDISIVTLDLSVLADADAEHSAKDMRQDGSIPLPGNSYDRGFCYLTLIRLGFETSTRVLADAARVLVDGGRFRFAVPDYEIRPAASGNDEGVYTSEKVFELVEGRLGFQVVSMRRFNPEGPYWPDDTGTHLLFDIRNPARS